MVGADRAHLASELGGRGKGVKLACHLRRTGEISLSVQRKVSVSNPEGWSEGGVE